MEFFYKLNERFFLSCRIIEKKIVGDNVHRSIAIEIYINLLKIGEEKICG